MCVCVSVVLCVYVRVHARVCVKNEWACVLRQQLQNILYVHAWACVYVCDGECVCLCVCVLRLDVAVYVCDVCMWGHVCQQPKNLEK